MKRIAPRILLLAVMVVAAVVGWRHFFPPPEAKIRARMVELQKLISFSKSEGNLAAWTSGMFGACQVTVRPCRTDCSQVRTSTFWGRGPFPWGGTAGGWMPVLMGGSILPAYPLPGRREPVMRHRGTRS